MIKILLLLFMVSVGYAVDTKSVSCEYVVFSTMVAKYKITSSSFSVLGKKSLADAGGQPFLRTNVMVCPNTYYMIVVVSTNTVKDNTFLNNTNVKKCIYLHRKTYLTIENGFVHHRDKPIRALPDDIWESY